MKRCILLSFCLAYLYSREAVAQLTQEDLLVPVTYVTSNGKKAKAIQARIQIRVTGDSAEVWAFDALGLPRVSKFVEVHSHEKLRRPEMKASSGRSLDSIYAMLRNPANGFLSRIPSEQSFLSGRAKYLQRKNSNSYFANQWVRLGSVKVPYGNMDEVSLKVKRFLQPAVYYRTELIPGALAWRFPSIDPWNCVPASERFFRLRKLQGHGIHAIKSIDYHAVKRQVIRKEFELYFEKDKSAPDAENLGAITAFLLQNDLVILRAEMAGAASVEGSPERNEMLKRERAAVLTRALKKYGDVPVKSDTVIYSDSWMAFRKSLKTSPYAWLDSLSEERLQGKLNAEPLLVASLESYLKQHRKATLKLVMAKVLSHDEQFMKIAQDLAKWSLKLVSSRDGRPNKEAESRCMGMLGVLFNEHVQGNLSRTDLEEMILATGHSPYLYVLLGYQSLRYLNDSNPTTREWMEVADYWFSKAKEAAVALTEREPGIQKRTYLRMCADFQAFEAEMVTKGLIDASRLCVVEYPDRPEFMGLTLNHYALIQLLNEEGVENLDCMVRSGAAKSKAPLDSISDPDRFLAEVRQEFGIRETVRRGTSRVRKVTFDNEPKGAYYYLLRTRFLKNDPSVMKWVEADDGASVELNAFNLFDLLSVTLQGWDPMENKFYDKEVMLPEIHKLISRLKRSASSICPPQVNALYLEYHLKALYYIDWQGQPGNLLERQIAESSLKFIAEYYAARAKVINSFLALHIVKQLNLFSWIPGSKAGAWYGYEVLRAVAKHRMLNDEELRLFARYIKMYDPGFRNPLPGLYDRKEIEALWITSPSIASSSLH